ncbi:hypothetical protein IQ255_10110 [Pleurocapsales cyanobacterium LEGE 10410]|nr:hypothetical protein [Pleurocapsales cyanobacterium LEGE 10410]
MEDTEQNKPKQISELERAKAVIVTLVLAIAVCLGLIIYTLTTYNPAIDFLDSSLFKPGVVWLGFIGLGLLFISFLLFGIANSVFRFLPDKKPLDNVTAIRSDC